MDCRHNYLDISITRILRVIFFCLVALLPALLSAQQLPDSIVRLLKKHDIPLSAVSLDVQEAASQDPLISLNSQVLRNPASVIKLLTTLSALEILGPTYQWNTRYWADGSIHDGVLKGNLVLQGWWRPVHYGGTIFTSAIAHTATRHPYHYWRSGD